MERHINIVWDIDSSGRHVFLSRQYETHTDEPHRE
jgi:hypothetical protein